MISSKFYSSAVIFLSICLLLQPLPGLGQKKTGLGTIYSGIPWFDNHRNIVSAHGANILIENGTYYLFGEAHSDSSNAFAGFNCYSSTDLSQWKFESVVLPLQAAGRLGPNRVGERPKVLKCPSTGEFIMLMHTDTLGYKDPCIGFATSKSVIGPYVFQGPILYRGKPIKKWDMGTFQDSDGSGYLLIHSGLMYKLSSDYKSISEEVVDNKWRGSESPAMFKKAGIYFWLASDLTSWERNDNFYYTATQLKGPWTLQGKFTPEGSLTWNSQTSFVLPLRAEKDTTFLFMGDRWSYPKQASAATYVWQPLQVSAEKLSIPFYQESWRYIAKGLATQKNNFSGTVVSLDKAGAGILKGHWSSISHNAVQYKRAANIGDTCLLKFRGRQIALYGLATPDGGYCRLSIEDQNGKVIKDVLIDLYSKYNSNVLLFLSPLMVRNNYLLRITLTGEHSSWSDKRKNNYGSTGNAVNLQKIVYN